MFQEAKHQPTSPGRTDDLAWADAGPPDVSSAYEASADKALVRERLVRADSYPLRNIGIIAHIDAGKTTTTERILYYTGRTFRMGNVDDGTTVTDWMDQERERGITIQSAAVTCFWTPGSVSAGDRTVTEQGSGAAGPGARKYQINIIDTPGHIDFTAEVQRSLRVLDGGVVLFDGVAGVQPQSETVWRQADRYGVPRICFVNKMDRTGADFERTLAMIAERLTGAGGTFRLPGQGLLPGARRPVAVQIPLGSEESFAGVVDLVRMRAVTHVDDLGAELVYGPIPERLQAQAELYREALLEALAELDDDLAERYLEGWEIAPEQLIAVLRKGTISTRLFPVLCGSSLRNKGVQLLLDAIVDYLPSPLDLPPVVGLDSKTGKPVSLPSLRGAGLQSASLQSAGAKKGPDSYPADKNPADKNLAENGLAALAFKVQTDPYMGRLVYLRVYAGALRSGARVYNVNRQKVERIGSLVRMYADSRETVDEIQAGDIGAVLGIKFTFTGDTLGAQGSSLLLESISFPDPVISVAIEPRTEADQDKMSAALQRLAEEDPTFQIRYDEGTGQTLISGMGELHLEVLVDRMLREFKVGAHVGRPRVAYRETVTGTATAEGRFIRQSGGRGQYGHVVLKVEPAGAGKGLEFKVDIAGGVVPREYWAAVEKGVAGAMDSGPAAGYPVVDLKVTLVDGSYHEVDSSSLAFEIAASMALKEGLLRASPVLLEPVMNVEAVTPEAHIGEVLGDLGARNAQVLGMQSGADARSKDLSRSAPDAPSPDAPPAWDRMQYIRAMVPMAEMFGYATSIRSYTQGRGTFTMEFDHYEPVPAEMAERIALGYGR